MAASYSTSGTKKKQTTSAAGTSSSTNTSTNTGTNTGSSNSSSSGIFNTVDNTNTGSSNSSSSGTSLLNNTTSGGTGTGSTALGISATINSGTGSGTNSKWWKTDANGNLIPTTAAARQILRYQQGLDTDEDFSIDDFADYLTGSGATDALKQAALLDDGSSSSGTNSETSVIDNNISSLVSDITGSSFTNPYADNQSTLAENVFNYDTYSDPYADKKSQLVDDITNYESYSDPYADKKSQLVDDITNYESYSDPYAEQINSSLSNVLNYDDYTSAYGDRISGLTDDLLNYTGPYDEDVASIIDYLQNASYDDPYADKIASKLEEIENTEDYTSDPALQEALDKILNREDFSYDINGDELWAQYKDTYTRAAQQAMRDAMGQAQSATGGYGNSYAAAVGNQAYNSQMQELSNIIPTLYSDAYQRYQDEGDTLNNNYSLLADKDNTDYNRYQDSLNNQYNLLNSYTGLSDTAYNRFQNDITNKTNVLNEMQEENNTGYDRILSNVDTLNTLDETDFNQWLNGYDVASDQFNQAIAADENAYDKWQGNFNVKQEQLDSTLDADANDYNQWLNNFGVEEDKLNSTLDADANDYNQWLNNFGVEEDKLNSSIDLSDQARNWYDQDLQNDVTAYDVNANERDYSHQLEREAIEDSRYDAETAYSHAQDAADMGIFTQIAQQWGLSDEELAQLEYQWTMAQALGYYDSTGLTQFLQDMGIDTSLIDETNAANLTSQQIANAAAINEATMGDSSVLAGMGYDTSGIDDYWKYYLQQMQNEANGTTGSGGSGSSGSSSSSSGSSSSSSSSASSSSIDFDSFAALVESDPEQASQLMEYYEANGASDADLQKLIELFYGSVSGESIIDAQSVLNSLLGTASSVKKAQK